MRAWLVALTVLVCTAPRTFPEVEGLEKKTCGLPPGFAGTTGHVLLRYQVNQGGHVNYVEPVWSVVSPPEKTQDLFQHLRHCLEQWKFPPGALVDAFQGFHYFGPLRGTPELVPVPGNRKVPLPHIQDREAKLRLADLLLEGPERQEVTGNGWVLRTNVRPGERQNLVSSIQRAERSFEEVFPGRPGHTENPVIVIVFAARDSVRKLSAFDNLYIRQAPGGEYIPEERVAYTYASRRDAPLKASEEYVRHEVTHHLVFDRLSGFDRDPPYWVNEGIATFMASLRSAKKDTIDRFKFVRGQQVEGAFRWPARSDRYIGAFEHHAAKLPDPDRFLRGDFDEMDVDLAYGLSWILVHYLINGEQGALYRPFVAWMTSTMGSPDDKGIAAALGRTPAQIFAALPAHVLAMKRGG
jgi:hypothetical protein